MANPGLQYGIRLTGDGRVLVNELGKVEKALDRLSDELRDNRRASEKTEKGLDDMGKAAERSGRKSEQAGKQLKKTSKQTNDLNSSLGELKTLLLGVAGAWAIKEAAAFAIQLEGVEAGYKAIVGSSEAARREMGFAARVAEDLGLSYRDLVTQHLKLTAATKDTALEGSQTREIFLATAEASRVLNLSVDQTNGLLTALTQIASKGKVQAEELRGQIGERLYGAFQIAAQGMGMSNEELSKALELGQLYADDFLPKFARAIRTRFGDAVADSAGTASAELNRFRNDILELQATAGGEFLRGFTEGLVDARTEIQALADGGVAGLGAMLGDLTGILLSNLDVVTAVGAAYITGRAAFLAFTAATTAATKAMALFNGTAALNPIGAIATLLASAVGYWLLFRDTTDKATKSLQDYLDVEREVLDVTSKGEDAIRKRIYMLEHEGETLDKSIAKYGKQIPELEKRRGELMAEIANIKAQHQKALDSIDGPSRVVKSSPGSANRLTELKKELSGVNLDLDIFKGNLRDSEQIADAVDRELALLNEELKKIEDRIEKRSIDKLTQQFEKLENALDPIAGRQNELVIQIDTLARAYEEGLIDLDRFYELSERLYSEVYPDADAWVKRFTDSQAKERDMLLLGAEAREIEARVQAKLNEAKREGIELSQENIRNIRQEIEATVQAEAAAAERIKAEEKAAKQVEEIWQHAAENMHDAYVDFWDNMLSGRIDSFKDFAKEIGNIWKRGLAEQLALKFNPFAFGGQADGGGAGSFLFDRSGDTVGPIGQLGDIMNQGLGQLSDVINGIGEGLGFGGDNPLTLTHPDGSQVQVPGAPGTSFLGTLGQGAGLGLFTSGILGGNSTTGAIGGALGSTVGQAFFGPLGGLVGGILGGGVGGFISSIFGSKKPRAGTTLSIDNDGQVDYTNPRTYSSKADPSIATGLANLFSDQLGALALALGAELQAGLQIGEIGYRKDKFVFDPTANAEIQDFGEPKNDHDTQVFETEEEAVRAALAHALSKGVITGVSDEVANYLKQTTKENLDTVLANIDFLKAYDELTNTSKVMGEAEQAIHDLNASFEAAMRQAKALGLSIDKLEDARQAELDRLRTEFQDELSLNLLGFTDPAQEQLQRLRNEYTSLLEDAVALGVDTAEVTALFAEEQRQLIEDIDASLNAVFNSFQSDLQSLRDELAFGGSSNRAPIEQLGAAQDRFDELKALAADGDEQAASQIFAVTRRLLELGSLAYGSSGTYAAFEEGILAELDSLGDALPRVDVEAIASQVGSAALTDEQVSSITATISEGNDRIAELLETIADNTSGSGTDGGNGWPINDGGGFGGAYNTGSSGGGFGGGRFRDGVYPRAV